MLGALAAGSPAAGAQAEPAAAAAAGEPSRANWGAGWSVLPWNSWYGGGPTLRRRLGSWQLGLAAAPTWSITESSRTTSELDGEDSRRFVDPSGLDRASGWARLEAGRDLWRQGRLSLGLLAIASYGWSRYDETHSDHSTWSAPPEQRTWTHETERTTWGVGLGLRPRYALLDRLTIDFEFGFALLWWDERSERWRVHHGTPEWRHERHDAEGTSFETVGGWGGLGSLNLIYWF